MIVGLTGGIASGKSTVSEYLRQLGYKIIDADKIAREVVDSNLIKTEIGNVFPEAIENGNIDRKKLRIIVFNNSENIEKINKITHPAILKKIKDEIEISRGNEIIFADIPLLFETGLDKLVDITVVISCNREIQIQRVIARDNSNEKEALKIIDSQMTIEEKEKLSNYIIRNNYTKKELEAEIEVFLRKIKNS